MTKSERNLFWKSQYEKLTVAEKKALQDEAAAEKNTVPNMSEENKKKLIRQNVSDLEKCVCCIVIIFFKILLISFSAHYLLQIRCDL